MTLPPKLRDMERRHSSWEIPYQRCKPPHAAEMEAAIDGAMTLHTRPSRMINVVNIAGKGCKDLSCKCAFTNELTPLVVKKAPRKGMRRMGSGNQSSAMPASTAMNDRTSVTLPWETSAMLILRRQVQ